MTVNSVLKPFLFLGLLCPVLAFAGESQKSAALLLQKLEGLKSFKARFEQQLLDANGNTVQFTTGSMEATRPGKLRWQTDEPFEQLIVADGETVWLYDPDLLQVTAQPYPKELARTPAMLLIGQTEGLEEQYGIEQSATTEETGTLAFTLTPKGEENLYSKVILTFNGELPVSMVLFDTLQQETRIEFSSIELNRDLDKALFSFRVPDGADLIWNE